MPTAPKRRTHKPTPRTDRRPSAAERGYDSTWTKLRNAYVKAHPLCEWCQRRGRVTVAEVVDHVQPVDEKPWLRLVTANLQSLCRSCHWHKTEADKHTVIYVVCGPPGAGKTTWVRQRSKPGDLVWDVDTFAGSLGFPTYPRPRDVTDFVLSVRRDLMERIRCRQMERNCYVIISDEADATRFATECGAELVNLQPGHWRR